MPALRRRFAGAAPRPREVAALEARSRSSVGLPVERLPASALSVALLPGCVGERGEISIFDGKRDNALARRDLARFHKRPRLTPPPLRSPEI